MKYQSRMIAAAVAVCALAFSVAGVASDVSAQEKVVKQIERDEAPAISPEDKLTIKRFDERLKQYVKLRETVKAKAPKLTKDSTPEQIQAAETAFAEALRNARAGAKVGSLFAPDIAQYIRTTLKREFKGQEEQEVRKVVTDKETNIPVPLKVNYPYPDSREFVTMPSTLLLKLPPLPKELKYRYVGRNLLLVDNDNNLIIDYMLDALP